MEYSSFLFFITAWLDGRTLGVPPQWTAFSLAAKPGLHQEACPSASSSCFCNLRSVATFSTAAFIARSSSTVPTPSARPGNLYARRGRNASIESSASHATDAVAIEARKPAEAQRHLRISGRRCFWWKSRDLSVATHEGHASSRSTLPQVHMRPGAQIGAALSALAFSCNSCRPRAGQLAEAHPLQQARSSRAPER